ncbi:MAG TPA: hypothetical protein DCP28_02535, partial [Cytophagales bacterium]|nr:hypothetical protein [Cytophagales bacterium]
PVDPPSTGCDFSAANGDWTASVTDQANPTVTWTPDASVQGGGWAILTAYVDGNIMGGFFMQAEGDAFTYTLNGVNVGDTLAFFFTYGLPQGGQ